MYWKPYNCLVDLLLEKRNKKQQFDRPVVTIAVPVGTGPVFRPKAMLFLFLKKVGINKKNKKLFNQQQLP